MKTDNKNLALATYKIHGSLKGKNNCVFTGPLTVNNNAIGRG
jgi:hypothetical protein